LICFFACGLPGLVLTALYMVAVSIDAKRKGLPNLLFGKE